MTSTTPNNTVQLCYSVISYLESSPTKAYTINVILACIVNAILTITGTVLNSLVIVAFWKSPVLRSNSPFFLIMVLSVTDLSVVLTVHPLFIWQAAKQLAASGDCTSKAVYLTVATLLPGFSGMSLHVINIERYLAIVYPFFYQRHVTRQKLLVATFVLWSLWIPVATIPFFNDKLQSTLISISATIVCATTVFVYVRIFQIARRKRRVAPKPSVFSTTFQQDDTITGLDSEALPGETRGTRRSKLMEWMKDIKLAKMFILLVVCSQVCYLPDVAYHVYLKIKKEAVKTEWSLMIGGWVVTLIAVNSTLNSLIFFWKNSQLRREMLRIAKCD